MRGGVWDVEWCEVSVWGGVWGVRVGVGCGWGVGCGLGLGGFGW